MNLQKTFMHIISFLILIDPQTILIWVIFVDSRHFRVKLENKVKTNLVILVVFFVASGLWKGGPWDNRLAMRNPGEGWGRKNQKCFIFDGFKWAVPLFTHEKVDYAKLGHLSGIFVTLTFWGGALGWRMVDALPKEVEGVGWPRKAKHLMILRGLSLSFPSKNTAMPNLVILAAFLVVWRFWGWPPGWHIDDATT